MAKGREFRGLVSLIVSGILELAGIAAIVWGFALIAPVAGFIAGGLALMVVGLMVDPPKLPKKHVEDRE